MKILIFSDTHLTTKFDAQKFHYLCKIIKCADQVIINGDFWDSWFTSFDNFVKSKWNQLFPLLLKKHTVYIYGNHDPAKKCDDRVKLFSETAAESYDCTIAGKTYHIEHGHKLTLGKREAFVEIQSYMYRANEDSLVGTFLHYLEPFFLNLGSKVFGGSFFAHLNITKKINKIMKTTPHDSFLICGDTHHPELDLDMKFANTGNINRGFASYCIISDDGIKLYEENY